MADQDYPNLYEEMEDSAQRTRAAAIAFEHVLGGPEEDMVPVNGYPAQPTIAGRFEERMDAIEAPVNAAIEAAKRYIGTFASAPTQRADGTALQVGDSYFDLELSAELIWNGFVWYTPNVTGQQLGQGLAELDQQVGELGQEVTGMTGLVIAEANRAEAAADAAQLSGGVYADTATGLAATAANRYFSVPSAESIEYLILYQKVSNAPVEVKRYPSVLGVPKPGVEGVYNLVNPAAKVVEGVGINGSSDYVPVPTVKSLAIRVTAGQPIVISNPAGNYVASQGYGAAFFSDLPTGSNKVAAFNATTLTNAAGLTYRADVVPTGAKYLVLNTEFQGAQTNWFAAYDTIFTSIVAFEGAVARVDGLQVFDRKARSKLAEAFSAVEGSENLYNPSALLVGYVRNTGGIARDNAAWRYIKIAVVEGRTYAIYTGSAAWAYPVMGSYGVNGAEPAASGAIATLAATSDPTVRTFTVPTGLGITHLFFNVYIKPPGGDIDFTSVLVIREGTSVPVRPLPYVPALAKVNGLLLKDSQARAALGGITEAMSQRTGLYNLLDPSAPVVSGTGINGQANYGALATAKSLAIPVVEGMPIVISNPAGTYRAPAGYGAAFFSDLPTGSNKVRAFNNPLTEADTITLGSGLTYRKDVVPAGAKYLVVNTEFQGTDHQWFVAYDTGFTAAEAFTPAVSRIAGLPLVDRTTQILAKEISRLVARRFAGKKVYYFGDSITQGSTGEFASYTNIVTEILQCVGTNFASSGSKTDRLVGIMTNLAPRDGATKVHNPDYTDVAAVTIMIGTNDASSTGNITGSLADIPTQRIQDLPFTTGGGVVVTTPDEYWALFPNTYYGNLSLCIEYVKWKNPQTVIYLISATQRPPGAGITVLPMDAVVVAMTAIARFYALQYLNATHECGLDLKGMSTWSYDMLHPNNAIGVPRLGKYVGYKILHS